MKSFIKVLLLLFLYAQAVSAEVILDSENQKIELSDVAFLEDKEGKLTFQEVKNKAFSTHEAKIASFGFTSSVYWFKIPLSSQESARSYKWWLDVGYPLLDELDLYICDDQGRLLESKQSGKARPFKERELKDRHFLFELDTLEKQMLYLRVKTQSSMQVPLSIMTSEKLFTEMQYLLIISGLYYGIFLLIFFYNLVSLIYTRSRKYFLYLVFISSFIMYQLALDGIGIQYFWSEWEWMISHGSATMMGITTAAVIMFTREFLRTKEFAPRIDRALLVILFIMCLVTLAALFRPYSEMILIIATLALILPPLLLAAGIISYKKKFSPARFYIAGWGSFLGGTVIFAMNKFSWIAGFEFLSYAQQVGSALEMIFLSWALADSQKQAEDEYLQKLNGLNVLLQERVDESLAQMRQNDQVLIEKSRLAAMGEMIEQIAHQWRQPLHSLSLLNQDLYFKVQLQTVTQEDYEKIHDRMNEQLQYMSQTIDDFRNFSKPDKKEEIFYIEEVIESALNLSEGSLKYAKVKATLLSEDEHAVFGMRHEIMQVCMNLIKNVKDVALERKIQDPWLKFVIKDKGDVLEISVEDNAQGINEDKIEHVFEPYFSTKSTKEGSGIGLYMSKEIIEKSFFGTISVRNSQNGACFTIVLPKSKSEVSLD